jgi:hypothetical protein
MIRTWTCNRADNLANQGTTSAAVTLSNEFLLSDRQIPDACAGCRKDRIRERCNERRHARFADPGRRCGAVNQVHVRLPGDLINASYGIVVEIRLIDDALGSRNLTGSRHAGSEHHGAFELCARQIRIHNSSRVNHRVDPRNVDCSPISYFHFHNRGHVGKEAAMSSNAKTGAFAGFALAPLRFFGNHLRHTTQPRCVDWIDVIRSTVVLIARALEILDTIRADEFEQVFQRIAPCLVREFIGE